MKNSYKFLLVVIMLVLLGGCAATGKTKLLPFTTDGCSRFPDGTISDKDAWLACCVEHDRRYWRGGSYQERLAADEELRRCVSASNPAIAELMFGGVRVGGSPYWPTSFRWGYGWPYVRGYKPLTEEEQSQVDVFLKQGSSGLD